LFFILPSLLGCCLTAPAQLDKLKNKIPEQRPKTQTEFMKLKLGLNLTSHARPKVEFIGDR
jgi:hypothetical protein